MMNNSPASEKLDYMEHSELLAIYNADIAFIKSLQWKVTNYAILAYGATIGTAKIVKDTGHYTTMSFAILPLLTLVVFSLGSYILSNLESSLKEGRSHLGKVIKEFTPNNTRTIIQGIVEC